MKSRHFEVIPKRKKKIVYLYVPTKSNPKGFYDEGISDILKKPKRFRYSEAFLNKWYADITEFDLQIKFVKNKKDERGIIK
jgi:hypothetical protein